MDIDSSSKIKNTINSSPLSLGVVTITVDVNYYSMIKKQNKQYKNFIYKLSLTLINLAIFLDLYFYQKILPKQCQKHLFYRRMCASKTSFCFIDDFARCHASILCTKTSLYLSGSQWIKFIVLNLSHFRIGFRSPVFFFIYYYFTYNCSQRTEDSLGSHCTKGAFCWSAFFDAL